MGGKGGSQTIGHKYYIGLHMILCYGIIDELFHIKIGDRTCYQTTNGGGSDTNITSSGQYLISGKDKLFGGEKREGGVGATEGGSGIFNRLTGAITGSNDSNSGGDFHVAMGEVTQVANAYLDGEIAGEIPGYRGMTGLIFQRFYFGNNPYIKDFIFQVARYPDVITLAGNSKIGDDANPAHMLFEVLTNKDWGMGYATTDMDVPAFTTASDTLFTEGFGMSLVWGQSSTIQDFVSIILDHIDGSLFLDTLTGLFVLKLIRDDYTLGSLPIFDDSNIVDMKSFSRKSWGETINELTVVYKDASTGKDIPITVQDMANIQLQGTTVNSTRQYPGISDKDLALKVAQRDLTTLASPIATVKIRMNREGWTLNIGDAFKLSWPKYGVISVVFRVGSIDYGSLKNPHIVVDAIEDAFALPSAVYGRPQDTGWVSPLTSPQIITNNILGEMNYWQLVQAVGEAEAASADVADNQLLVTAAKPDSNHYSFDVLTRPNGAALPFSDDGNGEFAPSGLTVAEIPQDFESTFTYSADTDMFSANVSELLEMNGEIMQVYEINVTTSTIKVWRGMLDTVPIIHAAGSRFYINQNFKAQSVDVYTESDLIDIKLLSTSGLGVLAESTAPTLAYTFTGRQGRPYPPGNVQVDAYPAFTPVEMGVADVNITWKHRDRTQQTGEALIYQDGVSIGPEVGTTYTVRIYDQADVIVKTATGITGELYDWTTETADGGTGWLTGQEYNNNFRFEIESIVGGRSSHQNIDYSFQRPDYGFGYGNYYGGFP